MHRLRELAQLRVGTKLMLLAMLPVACLLAFALISGIDHLRDAQRLRDFRTASRVSFATAAVADDLARERLATVLARIEPGASRRARLAAARDATTRALRRARQQAGRRSLPVDVAGRLDAASRQRAALLLQASPGSLDDQEIAEAYGTIVHDVLNTVRALDAGRPSRASGAGADAYVAILQAVEAAARERVDLAELFAPGHRLPPGSSRWETLEAAQLDAFRNTATGPLSVAVQAVLFSPSGVRVQRIRDELRSDPSAALHTSSLEIWVSSSGNRIAGLRTIAAGAARSLDDTASHDLDSVRSRAYRELALSLGVLLLVAGLALALRRSITRPLQTVSQGAQRLSSGDLTVASDYTRRDEIGAVAAAFRALHVTAERLAGEIRGMNAAIRDNRLDHRADLDGFGGTWTQLLSGMNDTMAAFGEVHGRRLRAEREAERIFNLSPDLLCIADFEGHFKRVNPAFEDTLGYTVEDLLVRPFLDFVHPDDRERTRMAMATLARGEQVVQFENRYVCKDGSLRWMQWNSRPAIEEGLVYAAARDVTESRRAADEQAALRRVATLVAQAAPPEQLFQAVAAEVDKLLGTHSSQVLRYEANGRAEDSALAAVASTRRTMRVNGAIAAPIIVDNEVWGAIVTGRAPQRELPADTEARLTSFAGLVATAIANADSRAQLAASRARVVEAADQARRRIERDLHDGVQQRLVSLALQARTAEDTIESSSPEELRSRLAQLSEGLASTFDELREISTGIHPAILSRGGVGPAIRALARRSPVPVELNLEPGLRLPERVGVAVYYLVSEALTNVAKHARATMVRVDARLHGGILELTIHDDGVGGAIRGGGGSGLIGLTDRVEALDGSIHVASPPGEGTTLTVTLPVTPP